MREVFIICVIGLLIGLSATLLNKENAIAEVNQQQGFYLFVDSKPKADYDFLGTVKFSFGFSTQYQSVRDGLIKKARKKFPDGDGIIFYFNNGGIDKADVIKFGK